MSDAQDTPRVPVLRNAGLYACLGVILLAVANWVASPIAWLVLTIIACVIAVLGFLCGGSHRLRISFH